MSISVKEIDPLVIGEKSVQSGFYLGPARPSVEKPHLQVRPVLFLDGEQTIGFLLRVPEGIAIRQRTGQDVQDYQEAEGVVIAPFDRDHPLNKEEPVLVIAQGSQEVFIMRPERGCCYGRQYDSHTKTVMMTRPAHRISSRLPYGFTIELDPTDGLVLFADSYITPSSY